MKGLVLITTYAIAVYAINNGIWYIGFIDLEWITVPEAVLVGTAVFFVDVLCDIHRITNMIIENMEDK